MGSMSNGGLCERSSIKRPLENGNCTSSGVPHKYKKRKVSAVRDFPPGCGRNAPRINQKPQETEYVASLGNEENLVADEKNVNDEIRDCSKPVQNGNGSIESLLELELTNSLDDLVAKVVAEAGKDMVKPSLIGDPSGSALPKALEINAPESSNALLDKEVQAVVKTVLEMGSKADGMVPASGAKALSPPQRPISNINISKETSLKNKIPRRRVSAIRDFPPFCGRNAPCPTEEECLKLGLGNKTLCAPDKAVEQGGMLSETVREQGGMLSGTVRANEEDIPVRETGRTGVEELDGDVQDGKFQKRQLEGNVETGRTGVEEFDGDVQNGKSQKRQLEGNVPVSKTKSQKRELEGNVLVPKTKSRKTSIQGKPLVEKVRADLEGSTVRETTGDGVEELNKDVRDLKSQKRQLEGNVETGRTGVEELDGDVQDGKSQKRQLEGNVLVPKTKSQKRELEGNVLVPTKSRKTSMQGKPLVVKVRADVEGSPARETTGDGVEELNKYVRDGYAQKLLLEGSVPERKTKSQKVIAKDPEDVNGVTGEVGKEIVIYSHDKSLMSNSPGDDSVALGHDVERVIVLGLMAAPNCPWSQGRGFINTGLVTALTRREVREEELQIVNYVPRGEKSEFVSRENVNEGDHMRGKSMKKKLFPSPSSKAASKGKGSLVVRDEEDFPVKVQDGDSFAFERPHDFEVMLPPFGPNSSRQGDARNKVRVTLRLFQAIYRKLLQGEEAKFRRKGDPSKRIDMQAAQIVRSKGKEVNVGKRIIGSVPGVEVGDEFQYRVELALVGIHRPYQAGIDYIKNGGMIICTSIVASGGYADDLDNPDVLIYSGQGGNIVGPNKQPKDQKLERGNLALKNCISTKNPVRVIRGFKETKASNSDVRGKVVATYTYDGLYTVEKYWQDVGQHGKLVFKFELWRVPGQQELAWKEAKKSNKFKIRQGRCVDDISGGKELFPICAVNTVDDEIPPAFKYITEMKYPDWYCPTFPRGCDCIGGCSDSHKCSCVIMNGGEIPYNYNGAIVEVKPLVYECSPYCKCPPSCYNRVTQHGIKIQLEIFKTESRGWGVRSLTSIPSGSFICEYIGELLEDKEAEQRHNDEYLFDIGQNYTDCMDGLKPDEQSSLSEVVEDSGFTIDAAQYGNVGRFINHSCSPNLYAQNVLYDHEDKKMPHIMFFAAENIPPLQELTYHYNYSVDQICDSNGNIKKKNCYCGSADCTGRMY